MKTLLTEATRIMGTPGFMAPEQIEGRKVDGRTDIFAFGAVLYHALSGRKPFGRSTVDETLHAILRENPAPLDDVPARLASIVSRCLAKNPSDRFQTAAELRATLCAPVSAAVTPSAHPSQISSSPGNSEAQHHYLLGRQALGASDMAAARAHLEQATRLDPHFAVAFYALADVWWYLGFLGAMPPRAANAQGIWYALRALELDDRFADTHALLAQYRKDQDYDWTESRRELERALELDPTSLEVRRIRAITRACVDGALEEACGELEDVLQSAPHAPVPRQWLAFLMQCRRDHAAAIAQLKRLLEVVPRFPIAHHTLALSLEWSGRHGEALEAMAQFAQLTGRCPHALGGLAWLEAQAAQTARAKALLDELLARLETGYVAPSAVVIAYLGLGDVDAAVEWFVRAIEARDQWSVAIKIWPIYDPIRTHPRYPELLRMMKMDP